MKLHIGSGSVYLAGWANVDVRGPKTFLAADRPDLVERWSTTEDQYYARHSDKTLETMRSGPLDQDYVCDHYGDFEHLPGNYWNADEVLTRHAFEHLSITEAHRALDSIDSMMKDGGILRIDVPDHEESMHLFKKTGDEFYIRHLLGPRRNDFGFHMMSYTKDRLRALVEDHGFIFVAEEPNIHLYPAFCLRFAKPGLRAPRDYAWPPPCEIPDSWKVLDVGPGGYPLPRANAFVDRDNANLKRIQYVRDGQFIHDDFSTGLASIPDKAFDYVWCSHVFEHVPDVIAAAAALSRIAKRGTLIVPSAWKESINNFEETEHIWQCLPNPTEGGSPIFIRNPEYAMKQLRNADVQKIMSRAFRTGPSNRIDEEGRHLRTWWYRNEVSLDVVHHWTGSLNLTVVQ